MKDRTTFEEAVEASQQKGIKFKLEDGTNISIQQHKFVYSDVGKSCEVGVWKDGAENEIKVFGYMNPERLGSLLIKICNGDSDWDKEATF